MKEFKKSVDGNTQYSQEELERLSQQGIDPNMLLRMSSEQQKYEPSLEKKLATEAFDVLRQGTRDAVQQEFSLVDLNIFPPSKDEEKYLSFWDDMYCSVVEILKEEGEENRSKQIFDLLSLVDDTLGERPSYLDLQVNGYEDLQFLREVLLTGDVNILYGWSLQQASQEVVREKGNPKVTYNSPYFPFRKNPYSVDIFEN